MDDGPSNPALTAGVAATHPILLAGAHDPRDGGGEKKEARGRESGVIFSDAPPEGRRAESRLVGALFLWALFFVSYYFLLADPLLALSKRSLRLAKWLAGRLAERWASRLARRLAS